MPRWLIWTVAGFFVVYSVTVWLSGQPLFIVPAAIIGLLVVAYAVMNRMVTRRVVAKHGSIEDAMSSEDEGIPSTHLIPDDETALGDTREAHDEVTAHDLPIDHPARKEAERETASSADTTRGNQASPAD